MHPFALAFRALRLPRPSGGGGGGGGGGDVCVVVMVVVVVGGLLHPLRQHDLGTWAFANLANLPAHVFCGIGSGAKRHTQKCTLMVSAPQVGHPHLARAHAPRRRGVLVCASCSTRSGFGCTWFVSPALRGGGFACASGTRAPSDLHMRWLVSTVLGSRRRRRGCRGRRPREEKTNAR